MTAPLLPRWLLGCTAICSALCHAGDAEVPGDRTLPVYQPIAGLVGSLSSTGSDTLANLMSLWVREFTELYPGVSMQVQASGSSTAPPALVEGTSDIGPMSRMMNRDEILAFETRYGYPPTGLPVAIDALAVFVHRDNPLREMSIAELDAVFSANRRCSDAATPIDTWGDLSLPGSWAHRPVVAYGRNSVSGTHNFFRTLALCKGDFRATVNELPGSASVIQAVGTTLAGIGYSSVGYATAGVRALAVAPAASGVAILPTARSAIDSSYPLTRFLYAYINRKPGSTLPALEREFIRFIYSRQGQRLVQQDGYVPLPASTIARLLKDLAP